MYLGPLNAGFRQGRQCADNVFMVSELVRAKKHPLLNDYNRPMSQAPDPTDARGAAQPSDSTSNPRPVRRHTGPQGRL